MTEADAEILFLADFYADYYAADLHPGCVIFGRAMAYALDGVAYLEEDRRLAASDCFSRALGLLDEEY